MKNRSETNRDFIFKSFAVIILKSTYISQNYMADKDTNDTESSFERSVYTEYFTLIEKDSKNVRVRCKLCPPAVNISECRLSLSLLLECIIDIVKASWNCNWYIH